MPSSRTGLNVWQQAIKQATADGPVDNLLLLWDIAMHMSRNNGETIERSWLKIMRAFWSGQFAIEGLMLRQRGSPRPDLEIHGPMKPTDLAYAVLGQDAVKKLGWRWASRKLLEYGVDQYRRNERYGYIFDRDPEGLVGLGLTRAMAAGESLKSSSDRKPNVSERELRRAFEKRVDEWPPGEPYPSEKKDFACMKSTFPDREIPRSVFRRVRREVIEGKALQVPSIGRWIDKGPRKVRNEST